MRNIFKVFGILIILSSYSFNSYAQPAITIEAFGGWLWTGQAGYNGSIKVDDKGNYGVRAGVSPGNQMVIEFEWNYTETTMRWVDLTGDNSEDVRMNYYLLGFNKELNEGTAIPYGLLNLGVLNLKGQTIDFTENLFTVGLGGGLKIYPVDRFGIRLQARLLIPMQFGGIGVGCGTGGCGTGATTYSTVIQGDFTGGVILRLGGS